MGLFSKLRGGAKPSNNNALAKAVLTPATLTMISDGSVDNSEVNQLCNMCGYSPIFFTVEPKDMVAMVQEIISSVGKKSGDDMLSEAKAELAPPLRETALLFAMRIAMADGRLDDGERNALGAIAGHFDIPEEQFMKMFEVIAMLQRGPNAT